MLKEMTLYGEVDKVKVAINRLKLHEPPEGYYVAFSGGKDSCVVLDLCKRAGVKYDAHYSVTTVDPPELIYFIRRYYPDAWENRMRPETSMWKLIPKKRMPPTQLVRYCCKYFKENGGGRFVVTGVRHQESAKRAKRKLVETCTAGKDSFIQLSNGANQTCGSTSIRIMSHTASCTMKDASESDAFYVHTRQKLRKPTIWSGGLSTLNCINWLFNE